MLIVLSRKSSSVLLATSASTSQCLDLSYLGSARQRKLNNWHSFKFFDLSWQLQARAFAIILNFDFCHLMKLKSKRNYTLYTESFKLSASAHYLLHFKQMMQKLKSKKFNSRSITVLLHRFPLNSNLIWVQRKILLCQEIIKYETSSFMFGLAFVKLQDFHTFAQRHKIPRIGTFRLYLNWMVLKLSDEWTKSFQNCWRYSDHVLISDGR